MRLKMSSRKWLPFCLGLDVLKDGANLFNCLLFSGRGVQLGQFPTRLHPGFLLLWLYGHSAAGRLARSEIWGKTSLWCGLFSYRCFHAVHPFSGSNQPVFPHSTSSIGGYWRGEKTKQDDVARYSLLPKVYYPKKLSPRSIGSKLSSVYATIFHVRSYVITTKHLVTTVFGRSSRPKISSHRLLTL